MGGRRTFCYVVGARPNFMKMAPVLHAARQLCADHDHMLVHTGQHYDDGMSQVFIDQLGVPEPDHHLGVASGTHGAQTAQILAGVETVLRNESPDLVVVAGDVNSTLAAALAAAKLGIPIAHVESGLRSFDREMPEEINRVLTDQLSELLFIHSAEARDNLLREGIAAEKIHHVGNTMIDTLVRLRPRVDVASVVERFGLDGRPYVLVTLHRPALTDGPLLDVALDRLERLADRYDVIFPAHPRTSSAMARTGTQPRRVRLVPPIGYLEFLALQSGAAAVLTDSGGIQEETTFLGVPCYTLRDTTERPVTISEGTNTLLGLRPERIEEIPELLERRRGSAAPAAPAGWDGQASMRIAELLREFDRGRSG